uniref:Galectin domain-containing protein n=1 Tax=Trichobilharzia regenti TaxID=157069 RepID=A0AA85K5C7_TRIRE|nr:unnamed protein product [Trichobilharzia regenti]
MKFEFSLPSTLQYGDCIEVNGKVGKEKFSMDLISDYLAIDPGSFNDQNRTDESELPIVETQPLQISIETTGSWDINANSPETSTTSHGSSAKRFGFRVDEDFVCRVVIKTEYYVVYLNDMMLSNSEHLVPVGSINGFTIDGDSIITTILFGDLSAIQKYNSKHNTKLIHLNTPKIIECRLTSDEVLATVLHNDNDEYSKMDEDGNKHEGDGGKTDDDVENSNKINSGDEVDFNNCQEIHYTKKSTLLEQNIQQDQKNQQKYTEDIKSKTTNQHNWTFAKTNNIQHLQDSNHLTRASSYQLVFDTDSDTNEEENGGIDEENGISSSLKTDINLSLFKQIRAKSIQNLFTQHENLENLLRIIQKHEQINVSGSCNADTLDQCSMVSISNKSLPEYRDSAEMMNSSGQLSRNYSSSQQLELVREEYELNDNIDGNNGRIDKTHKNINFKEQEATELHVLNESNSKRTLHPVELLSNLVKSITELTEEKSEISENTGIACEKQILNIDCLNNPPPEEESASPKSTTFKQVDSAIIESKIPVLRNGLSNTLNDNSKDFRSKPFKSACKGRFQSRETHSYPDYCMPSKYTNTTNKQSVIDSRIPKPRSISSGVVHQQNKQLVNGKVNCRPTSNSKPSTPLTSPRHISNKTSVNSIVKSKIKNGLGENAVYKNGNDENHSVVNKKSSRNSPKDTTPVNGYKCGREINKRRSFEQSPIKSGSLSPSSCSSLSSSMISSPSPTKPSITSDRFESDKAKPREGQTAPTNSTTTSPSLTNGHSKPLENPISNDNLQKVILNQTKVNQQCNLISQWNVTSTTKLKERDPITLSNGLHNHHSIPLSHQPLCENKHILNNVNNITSNNHNSKTDILKSDVKQDKELTNEQSVFNVQSNNYTDCLNDTKKQSNENGGGKSNLTPEVDGIKKDTMNCYAKITQNGFTNGNNTDNSVSNHGDIQLNLKENDYLNSLPDNKLLSTSISLSPSASSQSATSLSMTSPLDTLTTSMTSITTDSIKNGFQHEKMKNSTKFIQSPKKWLTHRQIINTKEQ